MGQRVAGKRVVEQRGWWEEGSGARGWWEEGSRAKGLVGRG